MKGRCFFMTDNDLKKLSRAELLELLLDAAKENDRLREEIELLKAQLNDRQIAIAESGTLAEAALKLSGIFTAADEAAKLYLDALAAATEE